LRRSPWKRTPSRSVAGVQVYDPLQSELNDVDPWPLAGIDPGFRRRRGEISTHRPLQARLVRVSRPTFTGAGAHDALLDVFANIRRIDDARLRSTAVGVHRTRAAYSTRVHIAEQNGSMLKRIGGVERRRLGTLSFSLTPGPHGRDPGPAARMTLLPHCAPGAAGRSNGAIGGSDAGVCLSVRQRACVRAATSECRCQVVREAFGGQSSKSAQPSPMTYAVTGLLRTSMPERPSGSARTIRAASRRWLGSALRTLFQTVEVGPGHVIPGADEELLCRARCAAACICTQAEEVPEACHEANVVPATDVKSRYGDRSSRQGS
jgi:hypothetical protein